MPSAQFEQYRSWSRLDWEAGQSQAGFRLRDPHFMFHIWWFTGVIPRRDVLSHDTPCKGSDAHEVMGLATGGQSPSGQ